MPLVVNFQQQEHADNFTNALRQLAHTLERKVDAIRKASHSHWKYRTNYESTANLSRISLKWLNTTGAVATAVKKPFNISKPGQLSRAAILGTSHNSLNRLETANAVHILRDGLAMQSAQFEALNRIPSPVSSTSPASGNPKH